MNCEHFVFNGEVKCDVRVRALYRIKVHIKGSQQNFQSVLSNINSYRFLITRNTFFIDCVVNHQRVGPTATGPEDRGTWNAHHSLCIAGVLLIPIKYQR